MEKEKNILLPYIFEYIKDNIVKTVDEYEKYEFIDMAATLYKTSKKFQLENVDAYGSFKNEEFIFLNAYGQEDYWEEFNYDVVALDIYGTCHCMTVTNNIASFETFESNIKIDLSDFGGKRGYYYKKNKKVTFRTTPEFYNSLSKEQKYPKGKKGQSDTHFTIYK